MWDLQFSNWLVGLAGAGATYVALVVFILFVYFIVKRINLIKKTPSEQNQLNFKVLAAQLITFGLILTVMFNFQSNAPKYQLKVEKSTPIQASSTELPEVKDLSPEKLTAEQSSERLQQLREKQKEDTSLKSNEGNN